MITPFLRFLSYFNIIIIIAQRFRAVKVFPGKRERHMMEEDGKTERFDSLLTMLHKEFLKLFAVLYTMSSCICIIHFELSPIMQHLFVTSYKLSKELLTTKYIRDTIKTEEILRVFSNFKKGRR